MNEEKVKKAILDVMSKHIKVSVKNHPGRLAKEAFITFDFNGVQHTTSVIDTDPDLLKLSQGFIDEFYNKPIREIYSNLVDVL